MTATAATTGDIVLGDIGECIYCRSTNRLGKEHLIPLSLAENRGARSAARTAW